MYISHIRIMGMLQVVWVELYIFFLTKDKLLVLDRNIQTKQFCTNDYIR